MEKEKLYQILNSDYSVVDTHKTLDDAKKRIDYIRSGFAISDPDQAQRFYIIELDVVFESGK
jgi:hypothetical protein